MDRACEKFRVKFRVISFKVLRKVPGEAARVSGQSGLLWRREKRLLRERHCPKVCQYATMLLEHSQLNNSVVSALPLQALRGYCRCLH